jgi:DNA polymerase I
MKLFIFDVSNMFYRAFWGNERLATSDGLPTQALHGFVTMAHSLMRDNRPDLVAFAMEGGGENLRKTMDASYKANREAPPIDLKIQLDMLQDLMEKMGYPIFKAPGYEADDTISTLAKQATDQGIQVTIVSSDKDFCQLVNENVNMYNLTKAEFVGEAEVYLRYGIKAEQFLDYLSIVGDTSDNIPGVKGIGEKGAAELIAQYGSLDGIYKNLNFIKGAKKDKLVASHAEVYHAQKMIKFMDVPGTVDFKTACKYNGAPDKEALRALFRRLEFRELEARFLGSAAVTTVGGVEIGVRK